MKINENLDISVKNYLGQLEKGVVVLLSVMYNGNSYEGTYWYDNDYKVLTLEEDLTNEIGDITEYGDYDSIMEFLDKNTSPFDDIYETLQQIK